MFINNRWFNFSRHRIKMVIIGVAMIGGYQNISSSSITYTEEINQNPPPPNQKRQRLNLDEDCPNPSCNSMKEMLKFAMKNRKKTAEIANHPYKSGCPVLREQLGASTWNLIHTMAANYPDVPDETDKRNMLNFFESLSYFYPCPHCAEDFQNSVASRPPNVSSREALSLWCCELHNDVNKKLGLHVFPCSLPELDLRWKIGHDKCWKGDETDKDSKKE